LATHHIRPPLLPSPDRGGGDIAAVGGARHGDGNADGAMPPATSGGLAGVEVGGLPDPAGGGLAGTATGELAGAEAAGGTEGTTSGGEFGANDNDGGKCCLP
jgi:hypothetical protein